MDRGQAARPRKPDSGHADTISTTVRLRRTNWNAMKPRIQRVLTQWNPGSIASGRRRQPVKAPPATRELNPPREAHPSPEKLTPPRELSPARELSLPDPAAPAVRL